MIQTSLSSRAWLELLLMSSIWGASFLAIRTTIDDLPILSAVAWRVGPAALLLWIYVLSKGLHVPRSPRIWMAFIVMGALNNAIPFTLMAWGQLFIPTGLTSILNASTAIFGVLLASLFFADERLSLRKAGGVMLGFGGVATAIGLQNILALDVGSLAQLAVIAGTVSYALASVWARKCLSQVCPQVAAMGMLTGSSLIMLPLMFVFEGIHIPREPITWIAVGYMSIFATAAAYLLYYRILKMAGSGNLMLCTLLVAPIAIVLGALLRAEELLPQAYIGFVFLALGLIVIDGRFLRKRGSKEGSCEASE